MTITFHMTDHEIRQSYRQARDPVMQIQILAELNAVSVKMMRQKLVALGLISAQRRGQARHSHWTAEEDRLLERSMDAGCSFAAVAARLPGRSVKSVRHRWHRLQEKYMRERAGVA
ncbi:MAG: SANT/Myb domain-containing protein [Clostridia bacterium]|nr:SANT/Myb domain-containing protein [Clostridia bacterium]